MITRLTLAALIVFTLGTASAQTDTVTGTWDGAWRAVGYSNRIVLHLAQDDERVTGTLDWFGGMSGTRIGIPLEGTYKNGHLLLNDGSVDARVVGNTLSGTLISPIRTITTIEATKRK